MAAKAKQGFRVKMANTLVKDHRYTKPEHRLWSVGDVVTEKDLTDKRRYPVRPNTWAWVAGGIVDPVGYETYVVVDNIPAGSNPQGRVRVGDVVTEKHFPDGVNFSTLLATGCLQPENHEAADNTEGDS